MQPIQDWEDAFGNQIAQSTTNEADLAGHYPFTPERWRVLVNGTRQFVQYNSIQEFTDIVDGFEVTPQNQGDTVTMRTAERFRYVVGYVLEISTALETNQSLQSGDAVIFGYGDPDLENSGDDFPGPSADGWFFHWYSDLDDDEVRLAEYRDGTLIDEVTTQTRYAITDWARYETALNWYNVGEVTYVETFTEERGADQRNQTLGKTSGYKVKGPTQANFSVSLSVKADSGAGNLTTTLGSVAARTLGDVEGIVNTKIAQISNQSVGTTGSYVPVGAVRLDPNDTVVSVDLGGVEPTAFGGTGSAKLVAFAVDPSKTDATNFQTPPEMNDSASAIEQTTNVSEMPDSTGTQTTNPTNPGGYQLAFGSIQGTQGQTAGSNATPSVTKAKIARVDEIIFAAYIPSSGSTGEITYEYTIEQDR